MISFGQGPLHEVPVSGDGICSEEPGFGVGVGKWWVVKSDEEW